MENGHLAVRQLRYLPAVGATHGVEVLSFAALRETDTDRRRTRLQRPDFHVLALITGGRGAHEADFRPYELREGDVVWIRPGVVHRWSDVERVEGPLILFQPGLLPDPGLESMGVSSPVCWPLPPDARALAVQAAGHLRREQHAAVRAPRLASSALLSHLLAALLLRVLPTTPPPASPDAPRSRRLEVFHAYRAAVEEHFARWHHVSDYAHALGYDPRTLTRATRTATGTGAKTFLDQRILLEAKRLLAHTGLSVGGCAHRLGFRDAGNFTTFFRRQTGLAPTAWTAALRSGRPDSG
ncbi:AraC family transcriptional regulator [Streptomyces sp. Ru62]|uniref:helix-turn-helix domain-containing protein n=1 Tax=Streptomyces sp. Ru62 TaxID=2080745 RepID=UPI000CDD8F9F|nr:AraC family transcriptional regulator [Streptomyces sp. Ru62]POX58435.1 AraC family transcriptional regulator [Streptomyces sp. Ru62]